MFDDAQREKTRNLAQAVVTVVVAVAFAAASYLAGQANGDWQQAVRDDVKWSAGLMEDVRYLFVDEAPVAFEFSVAKARADRLAMAAKGLPRDAAITALVEADATRKASEVQANALASNNNSLLDQKYWRGDHFDVVARLADARERAKETVRVDPDKTSERGDVTARWALAVALVPVPFAVAFVLIWGARRRQPRRKRETLAGTGTTPDVELIPSLPRDADHRILLVAFGAWVLLTLTPPIQIHHSLESSQNAASATRAAVMVGRDVMAGNVVASYEVYVKNRVVTLKGSAQRRALNLKFLKSTDAGQRAIVAADNAVEPEYDEIARQSLVVADGLPNVDRATVSALGSGPDEWVGLVKRQQGLSIQTEEAGRRSDALTLALLLAGIGTTLVALSKAERKSFSIPIMAGVIVIAGGIIAILGPFI